VTNITFIFETSPNTKPKEKKVGDMAYYVPPPSEKVGGHVPRQIAPMRTALKMSTHIAMLMERTATFE